MASFIGDIIYRDIIRPFGIEKTIELEGLANYLLIFIMEDKTILMQVTYTNEIDKREEYSCLSNQDKFKNLICIWAIQKQALINFRSEYI